METFGFQWHITDRCNCRCTHCYQDRFDAVNEKKLGDWLEMANRILTVVGNSAVTINITGGEPLLIPGLFELIGALQAYPNLHEIHLITNGQIVSEPIIKQIGNFPKITQIKVSLEAADAQINDEIRGKGSFAKVNQNIELLKATGKPIVMMMTLGNYNLETIPITIQWAHEKGLAGIIFERFVPLGHGLGLANQVLTAKGWRRAVSNIARGAGLDVTPDELLPYRAFWLSTETITSERLRGALCNLGGESMALMPDGTIYPCRRLPLKIGHVLNEPFVQILKKLDQLNVQRVRRALKGSLCGRCGIDDCVGCRALSYALTGDYLLDDNQCSLVELYYHPERFTGSRKS